MGAAQLVIVSVNSTREGESSDRVVILTVGVSSRCKWAQVNESSNNNSRCEQQV